MSIRYVKCTAAFREQAEKHPVDYSYQYGDDIDDFGSFVSVVDYLLTITLLWTRFFIALGSLVPLLLCGLISLNKGIESFCLWAFCWNCIFVNCTFTVFLAVRAFLLNYVLKWKDLCYYEDGIPRIEQTVRPNLADDFEATLLDELTQWTVYSVAFSLVMVRVASYRVCTSPLKYSSKGGERRLTWVFAMLTADLTSIVITWMQSTSYSPMFNLKTKALVAALSVGTIWLCDIAVSVLSFRVIFRFRQRNGTITSKQRSDAAKLLSFILLSISPSVQLIPFTFMAIRDAIDEYAYEVMLDCVSKYTGHDDVSHKEVEMFAHKCGYTEADYYASEAGVADFILFTCQVLSIFKPYVEAFTILFLFANFRAVLMSKTRKVLSRLLGRRQNTVFATSSGAPCSQHISASALKSV